VSSVALLTLIRAGISMCLGRAMLAAKVGRCTERGTVLESGCYWSDETFKCDAT